MHIIRRLAVLLATSSLMLPGVLAVPAAAAPNVTLQGDSADIDYFIALSSTNERSRTKEDSDFIKFAENLGPAQLTGPQGTAKAFAQQATTMVTPSTQPIPTGPLNGIGMSAAITGSATKGGSSSGTPIANPFGSMSADFTTSGPTPFQFDGAMLTANSDSNDCTTISVDLSGPLTRSFAASAGGECPAGEPHSKSFVVTDVLPAGDYTLSVDFDASMSADDASVHGQGKVSVNLFFFKQCSQTGTNAGETITGTPGDDVLCGRGGNDIINGLGGADEIFGGSGNDTLSGAGGADLLRGEVGNDVVNGGARDDQLLGSFGDDRLFGGGGKDLIKGEDGDDRGEGGGGPDRLFGGDGKDTMLGQTGEDRLDGGPRPDVLDGGADNDAIAARDHTRDVVRGGAGNKDHAFVDGRDQVTGVELIN